MTYDYLKNFPTIKKFEIVASCLLPKEKEGYFYIKSKNLRPFLEIHFLIDSLFSNNVISETQKNDLKQVYFL